MRVPGRLLVASSAFAALLSARAASAEPETPSAPPLDAPAPKRASAARPAKPHARAGGAVTVGSPAFEPQGEGPSRLVVPLSGPVSVEKRAAKGAVVLVLKGANVPKANDRRALVTVHFDTPVTRAKLAPAGRDVHLVLELRAAVEPAFRVETDKEPRLVVELPKGSYLPSGEADGPAAKSPPGKGSADVRPAAPDGPADATEAAPAPRGARSGLTLRRARAGTGEAGAMPETLAPKSADTDD